MQVFQVFSLDTQNGIPHKHEDLISLLAYLAQQTAETIADVEVTTKLTFSLLLELFQDDFHGSFLAVLDNLKAHDYVLVSSFKIHVHDKFIFKLLLFLSLKYKKEIFVQTESSFLQIVIPEILESINIVKFQSLHLLRLLELILKKREDVLTPDMSLSILKSMNQAAHSPLTGFKNWAHNVSRIVLRSLPCDSKKHLCNFNNLPIKGIDLNDILKQCEERDIRAFLHLINKQILRLFCNNTDSREGSFFYEALTNIFTFDEFLEKVWPHYRKNLREFNEGEFYQSFLKYWIPITVRHYRSDFYFFIRDTEAHYQIKVHALLETRRRGFYKREFDNDTVSFVKYAKTSSTGLKIVSTYMKKHDWPNELETKTVLLYLHLFSQFDFTEDVLKSLRRFLSQIFLVCHIRLDKTESSLYSYFLLSIYKFCSTRLDEVAAQILKLVWDVASGSSSNLATSYRIDRENTYDVGGNLYYQELKRSGFWEKTFLHPNLQQEIQMSVRQLKYCPNLVIVAQERYVMRSLPSLVELEKEIRTSVCSQNSEKIRLYANLIVSTNFHENDITTLCELFEEKIQSFEPQNMFSCVLILDVLITAQKERPRNVVQLLEKSLSFLDDVLDDNLGCSLNVKDSKVLESLINNVIECLNSTKPFWSHFNKSTLLRHLVKIIQVSNMKRPVSLAANLVNLLGASMETFEEHAVIIKLLDYILHTLYENKQNGKIRRNPETRLVIHALCLSDTNLTKPLLVSSVQFMLGILEDPLSSDSTLSSTLHSLEVLISDNSIHQLTLPFIVDIVKNCIQLFNRPSWIVRNADLQLLKALIERFLGVSLDENIRPKTIEDIFVLFPTLIPYFYEILSREHTDSALMVLLFFSSSRIKNDFFIRETLHAPFESFRSLFMKNIFANKVGFLTIEAFTSLCPNTEIPRVFSDLVFYIQRHFLTMNKNVFADLVKLLQLLQHKYESALVRSGSDNIKRSINALVTYLRPFNYFYFNLLSLKLFTVDNVSDNIVASVSHDYKTRIWMNNYLPFVMVRIRVECLEFFLQKLIKKRLPEFLQEKMLSILVDRVKERGFPLSKVITILILKLVTLSEKSTFLITAYSKTILLLSDLARDLCLSTSVIARIRHDFQTNCIYKTFVYVMALSRCTCRCENDQTFITKTVRKYIDFLEDDDVLVDLSTTITHLYRIVPIEERYNVIKLIFFLLLNEFTAFEMCKFVSWLTDSQSSSVLISLVNLLGCAKLSGYVGDRRLAWKLLLECYRYVDGFPEDLEESNTYYVIESELSLPKHHVKAVIVKSLEEFIIGQS